jgi:SAM-dependent methyltransferase
LRAFLTSPVWSSWVAARRLVPTRLLTAEEAERALGDERLRPLAEQLRPELLLEHEPLEFPSYPYEWPPEMLHAAAELTLELALELLPHGLGLKDGTPYNVLFRGPDPVFVDVLSVEQRDPTDPTWLAYAQFVRTFLLPLAAWREFGLPPGEVLLSRRDGLEPEELLGWLGWGRRLLPPWFSLVTMPVLLAARRRNDPSVYRPRRLGDPEKARFVLRALFRGLRRTARKLEPPEGAQSEWSSYTETRRHYSAEQARIKEGFVESALSEFRPRRVLDVGANVGHFSAMAARARAFVVAIDYDPVVVGRIWRMARAEGLPILPLVVNLARPTPAVGWRNAECPSFLDRARGRFDLVVMLAVIHHLIVTERIPLAEILDLAAELTTELVLIEFVGPEDPMFQRIVRGREHLHRGLSSTVFECACRAHFEIIRSQPLPGAHRTLYLLRKRPS